MKKPLNQAAKIKTGGSFALWLVFVLAAIMLFNTAVIAQDDVLNPGDIVQVQVERQAQLSQVFTINRDGKINFPLIGEITAAGMTLPHLAGIIKEKLADYIKNPVVNVTRASSRGVVRGVVMQGEGKVLATRVVELKYADAATLIDSVKGIVSPSGKVYADPSTNSLIATDYPENLDGIESVIKQLDTFGKEQRQVLVEAQIVELTNTENEDLGVTWFIPKADNRDFAGSFDKSINVPPLPTELTTSSASGSIGLQSRTSIPNVGLATLSDGGSFFFGKTLGGYDLSSMISALNTKGKAKILARPRILVENGQEARIEILTKIPYRELSRTATSAAGDLIFTTSFLDVGVILKVVPYIKRDGIVNLQVEPEVSFVQGQQVDIPIKVTRKASTRVNIEDGHTLVIGGLLQDRDVKSVKKVPILGDIPLLGYLFRSKNTQKEKTELMVFVTPRIMTKTNTDELIKMDLERSEEIARPINEETKNERIAEFLTEARWFYKRERYIEALKEVQKVYKLDKENKQAKKLEGQIRMRFDIKNIEIGKE